MDLPSSLQGAAGPYPPASRRRRPLGMAMADRLTAVSRKVWREQSPAPSSAM